MGVLTAERMVRLDNRTVGAQRHAHGNRQYTRHHGHGHFHGGLTFTEIRTDTQMCVPVWYTLTHSSVEDMSDINMKYVLLSL
eukprot:53718-Eustigmatos_ZCMA.PRE.1